MILLADSPERAITTCLGFAVGFTVAIVTFAHLELRYPHQGNRLTTAARLILPFLLGGTVGFLPACVKHWTGWSYDPTWIGVALGSVTSLISFWVHPHRLLFSDWHSPANGLALAYHRSHLSRIAENAASGCSVRREAGEGESVQEWDLAPGSRVFVCVAIPELARQATTEEIGRLKMAGKLIEYGILGPHGARTRPDAVYSVHPVEPDAPELRVISVPTILSVVSSFVRERLNEYGEEGEPSVEWRALEQRQFELFRGHVRRLCYGLGIQVTFSTYSELGLSDGDG